MFQTLIPEDQLESILSQPYRDCGFSTRVRVFLSQDEKYVLKCPLTPLETIQGFRQFGIDLAEVFWSHTPGDAITTAQQALDLSMLSYQLAWEKCRDLTGLLLIGEHPLFPGEFILLQKRANLMFDYIERSMSENRIDVATKCLSDLVKLIEQLWERGITEVTFNFGENYGYIEDTNGLKMVLIDLGELEDSVEKVEHEAKRKSLLLSDTYNLWLKPKFPELAQVLEDQYLELVRRFDGF